MKYACFAALSLFVLVGCGKPPPLVPPETPTVVVVTTEMQQVNPYLERIGRVKAREDSTLNARVTGYITEIPFKEGDFVTEGTRLIQIDPTPYQLAAQKLEASLARAKAETKLAVDNFERGKELVKKKVISEVQFEELRTKLDAQKSMEDETAASLASAKWDLQQTTIDAPFDGIVSDAQVSIGDLVQANGSKSLVTIVTVDPMEVYFDIDEGDMITFKRNEIAHPERANRTAANVKLRLPNNTLYEHVGRIDFVDNRINKLTGTIRVRAKFPNPERILVPDLYVGVRLSRAQAEEAILIPKIAVLEDQQGMYVFTVNSEKVIEKVYVEMGQRYGLDWAVKSGLEPGVVVVVEGLQRVKPDLKVDTQQRPATPTQQNLDQAETAQQVQNAQTAESGDAAPADPSEPVATDPAPAEAPAAASE